MKTYVDVHEAYLGTLRDVLDNPETFSSPRGLKVREKHNYMFKINYPRVEAIETYDAERNKVIQSYSDKEFELYDSQSNKAEDFAKASKFWLQIANPDGTINSAYGYNIFKRKSYGSDFETTLVEADLYNHCEPDISGKIFRSEPVRRTPYEYCLHALKKDQHTRQAVLQFAHPEVFWDGNKDITCTLNGVFSIRDDQLNLIINMRSNDLMLGLVYDLPWFISLMYKMVEDLKQTYPNLIVGEYTHFVNNIHIYERDIPKINRMLAISLDSEHQVDSRIQLDMGRPIFVSSEPSEQNKARSSFSVQKNLVIKLHNYSAYLKVRDPAQKRIVYLRHDVVQNLINDYGSFYVINLSKLDFGSIEQDKTKFQIPMEFQYETL